jgi:hypothetical protein
MTRMTREFSLVLVGAGILSAGYFVWPEKDFEKRSEEQARARVGGGNGRHTHGHMLFFIHTTSGARSAPGGARSPAMAAVGSRGFGSTGARISGGG